MNQQGDVPVKNKGRSPLRNAKRNKAFTRAFSLADPVTQGITVIHGVNKSPGLASSSGTPSRPAAVVSSCLVSFTVTGLARKFHPIPMVSAPKRRISRIAAQIHRLFICPDYYICRKIQRQFVPVPFSKEKCSDRELSREYERI